MVTGHLDGKTWVRRPELKFLKTKQHEKIPEITFTIGEDENGKVDVMTVQYPENWDEEKIRKAMVNRDEILKKEGCKHCKNKEELRKMKPNTKYIVNEKLRVKPNIIRPFGLLRPFRLF